MKKIQEFVANFLHAMDNHVLGHSLKKWITLGTFWLMVIITLKFTNSTNLLEVLVVLSGLILTLMGLNVADKKIKNSSPILKKDPNESPEI